MEHGTQGTACWYGNFNKIGNSHDEDTGIS